MSRGTVEFKIRGDWGNTKTFLKKTKSRRFHNKLIKYAKKGVEALRNATPIDTGLTASSWYYEIEETKEGITIYWDNSNVINFVPIALIIQYGHATRGGGWVEGRDYINPAIQPIFDEMVKEIWEEVVG